MRIIAGKYGGIRLNPVKGDQTRPTTDKVKEAIFSMVGPYFSGGVFLDLFAGSGAVGLESVSRGMDEAVLVDRSSKAIKAIKDNILKIKTPDAFKVIKGTASQVLDRLSAQQYNFQMVFLDPPYKEQKIVENIKQIVKLNLLKTDGLIICEVDNNTVLPDNIGNLESIKKKNYGLTNLLIYQLK